MRRRILRTIAERSFRFAGLVGICLALVTALAVAGASSLRFDTGLSDFLPPDSPRSRALGEAYPDYRNLEPVVVSLRGNSDTTEDELIEATAQLADLLNEPQYFHRPIFKVDALAQQYYDDLTDLRLIALMTPEDWEGAVSSMQERIFDERLDMVRAKRVSAFFPRRPDRATQDPLGFLEGMRRRLARTRAPLPVAPRHGYFFALDGRTVHILLHPVSSSDDLSHAVRGGRFLNEAREVFYGLEKKNRKKFTILMSGSLVRTHLRYEKMARELLLIGVASLGLLFLLLIVSFRKVESVVFTLVPPLLGTTWTLGLARAFSVATGVNLVATGEHTTTRITAVTLVFLILVFGAGLSYSIHLYHRFTFELYRRKNYYRALQVAYLETGRGILASAAISALIFFSLYLTSFRGLRELGMMAGVATLCNLAACLFSIPVFAAAKRRIARGAVNPVPLLRLTPRGLTEPALLAPKLTLVGMVLLTFVLGLTLTKTGFSARRLPLHPQFSSIASYLFRPAAPEAARNPDRLDTPGRPLVALVEASTVQEALEVNDALYAILWKYRQERGQESGILAIDSLRVSLPSLDTQRRSLEVLKTLDVEPVRETILKASEARGFRPVVFRHFLDRLQSLKDRAGDARLIEYSLASSEGLAKVVQRLVVHRGGGYAVATPIFPNTEGFAHEQVKALGQTLANSGVRVTLLGDPVLERALAPRIRQDLALFTLLSGALVFVSLLLHFKMLRWAVIAFIPILAQGFWLVGAMSLFGMSLHLLILLAVPLAVAMSVDNSIHILQRYLDASPDQLRPALQRSARPIVLVCAALGILYGTLSLSSFEGLRDLGLVIVFGAAFSVLGTLMLLPAMVRVWGKGQPILSVFAQPVRSSQSPPSPRSPQSSRSPQSPPPAKDDDS